MAEEIAEAVQIIRVAYDGVEIALKVGSGTVGMMQKAVELIKLMIDHEKTIGKTSMKKLVLRGGDLQVLQFDADKMKMVEKLAKKYGILYSVLPDVNGADGKREVIFHQEALPRVNAMLKRLNSEKETSMVTTFDNYIKSGDEGKLEKVIDFLKGNKEEIPRDSEDLKLNESLDSLIEKVGLYASEKSGVSVEQIKENFSINETQATNLIRQLETIGFLGKKNAEGVYSVIMDKDAFLNRVRGYQDLATRMRMIAASKDSSLSDITISKTLIMTENDHAVKTRIPGTFGDNARYIWIKKDNIMEIHSGKTMLTFLDNNKDYKIYDESNKVVETKRGEELYSHYDKVEAEVRERVKQAQNKDKAKTNKETKKPSSAKKR